MKRWLKPEGIPLLVFLLAVIHAMLNADKVPLPIIIGFFLVVVCQVVAALYYGYSIGQSCRDFDLVEHLRRQKRFSAITFGPGTRTHGVLDHIRKELGEIEANPADLEEWVDLMLLSFDGAWRAGFSPEEIAKGIAAKQECNESRQWPDWRTAAPGKAIEHVREVS